MTNQCPCSAELARLTTAYESAERKAGDHERDLIKLRGENATLRGELRAMTRTAGLIADERSSIATERFEQAMRAERLEDEITLLLASRLRFMRALGMVVKAQRKPIATE